MKGEFMIRLDETWNKALGILEKEVTAVSFDLWINSLAPVDFKNGVFYLSTTSETAKTRIIKLHSTQILMALKSISDEIKDFVVFAPDEREKYETQKLENPTQNETSDEGVELCKFNPKYTFDSFVVGNSNKYVYAACRGVAENPFSKINPLFIYGGVGLGKTHLLQSIGNYIRANRPELRVLYVTCNNFTNDYIGSLRSGKDYTNSQFREKYRNLDVLIIDDIQFISNRTSTQEQFFDTFNDLYQNNKQIIIASDRPPKEIATLEERLRSRFSMGLIQDIQSPDFETRLAILQKKAQQDNHKVDDEVLTYIAENCDTNIREMEGVLSKVCFYSELLGKEKTTLEDVEEALKDHIDHNKADLTADRIIDCVCKYFSISKDDLVGKKKNKEIVEPRQICMFIICEMLDLPLTSIGELFGGRDHTTVIHAREKVSQNIKENNRIKIIVSDIKNMVNRT